MSSNAAYGPTPRKIAPPFCWQSKTALRRIREAFDESTFLDQALAVYLAHTELASDEQSETYTATRRKIAERAGVGITRVRVINDKLRSLRLLDWKQNKIAGTAELAPNTYTMLGTPCPTSATPCLRLGTNPKRRPEPVVEESPEESQKNLLKKGNGKFRTEQIDPKTI